MTPSVLRLYKLASRSFSCGITESLILESKVTTATYNTDFKLFGGDFSQTLIQSLLLRAHPILLYYKKKKISPNHFREQLDHKAVFF